MKNEKEKKKEKNQNKTKTKQNKTKQNQNKSKTKPKQNKTKPKQNQNKTKTKPKQNKTKHNKTKQKLLMSGVMKTDVRAMSAILGNRYLRVEDYLKSASFLIDDISEENVDQLEAEGKELYVKYKDQVKALLRKRLKELAKKKAASLRNNNEGICSPRWPTLLEHQFS